MKKKHCPCCNSTLRFRRRRKSGSRLLFFMNLYTCSQCYTLYAWIKTINKPLCIRSGIPEKISKTTS